MHQFRRFFILAVLQLLSAVCLFGIDSKGAIIIANIVGEVEVLNNATQTPLSSDKVITGGVLFDGHTIKAGKGSKAILLMSSGTILTVRENSSINLKKFAQEPFTPGDKKLSELKSEPSPSETTVEVEKGDLIFNIKKLDKNSNFDIESPLGTAGIRGTAGSAGTDKLTLTEGAVQITPIGGGVPVPLGAGQTIAPAPGGGLNTQPASAEDMNSINSENAEAESNTADVSMEDAASAQSEVEEESAAEEEAAAEEEPAEEEAEEEAAEEEAAEEEA
ncbi:MAG: FecR domain-containing protein, partial [Opitutales bacterium]|nr:FecR domain-containing protein [Opitutales bacterium]